MHFTVCIRHLVEKKLFFFYFQVLKLIFLQYHNTLLTEETINTGEIFWDINFDSEPVKHTFDNYCGLK